jgi:hypothetical protein
MVAPSSLRCWLIRLQGAAVNRRAAVAARQNFLDQLLSSLGGDDAEGADPAAGGGAGDTLAQLEQSSGAAPSLGAGPGGPPAAPPGSPGAPGGDAGLLANVGLGNGIGAGDNQGNSGSDGGKGKSKNKNDDERETVTETVTRIVTVNGNNGGLGIAAGTGGLEDA